MHATASVPYTWGATVQGQASQHMLLTNWRRIDCACIHGEPGDQQKTTVAWVFVGFCMGLCNNCCHGSQCTLIISRLRLLVVRLALVCHGMVTAFTTHQLRVVTDRCSTYKHDGHENACCGTEESSQPMPAPVTHDRAHQSEEQVPPCNELAKKSGCSVQSTLNSMGGGSAGKACIILLRASCTTL
jgi:hypothetical protein